MIMKTKAIVYEFLLDSDIVQNNYLINDYVIIGHSINYG